jgi:hypothetical protein
VFALADAMREEYRAVVDAGFILQIDDPGVVTSWDMIKPEPSIQDYRRYLKIRIDALNHALAGIPEDRVRHHFCWGSWHGAHTHDLPLKEIIDLVPGVVSHATNLVEHPELIVQRIRNFADAVGRENVLAGADCGLGTRVHDDLVWAKLSALVERSELESNLLWPRSSVTFPSQRGALPSITTNPPIIPTRGAFAEARQALDIAHRPARLAILSTTMLHWPLAEATTVAVPGTTPLSLLCCNESEN